MYCRKCGSKIPDDSLFCEKCGIHISADKLLPDDNQESPSDSSLPVAKSKAEASKQTSHIKVIAISFCSVFMIAAIIVIVVLFPDHTEKSDNGKSPNDYSNTVISTNADVFGDKVSLEDLPNAISVLIDNHNLIETDDAKSIGTNNPIFCFSDNYECTIDTIHYTFRQSDSFVSLHIRSSSNSLRSNELKVAFASFAAFLYQNLSYDQFSASWESIVSGNTETMQGITTQYVPGEDDDTFVALIPLNSIKRIVISNDESQDNHFDENTKETESQESTDITLGKRNALSKAKDYLSLMAFSRSGLKEQLIYEGFSEEEAEYGVNNCGADWKEQAALKAKQYLDLMSFAKNSLIEQLLYDGFSQQEAEYGVAAVGY